MSKKNHKAKIEWMIKWAHKNKLRLELEGECGFGRECVGVISDAGFYPDYKWYDEDFNRIDNNGDIWTPEDAYHKHTCVSVLGRGEHAESQLYEWLKWFDKNNFKHESGFNENKDWSEIALILGKHRYSRMVKS